ncbi:phosphoglycerate dehydrogenase [Herbiconiux sp. P16]|uniref:phosphoglycerate dehydrogenase n=1 Tax=Herbiconiux wuyangfengii TaxID=3342794 RepID=UPI0035B91AF8
MPSVVQAGPGRRIAVTPRSLSADGTRHPALDSLARAGFELVFPAPGRVPTAEELLATVPGCVGWLAGAERIDEAVLQASGDRGLQVVSRNGVGVDAVDLATASRLGIEVATAPASNAQGVAELAIALVLASARQIPWHDAQLKNGEWVRRQGVEVSGRTLGVVGCGQIGQRVTHMALGLGMRVRAFDAYPAAGFDPAGDFAFTDLAGALDSDVVTLHAPGSDDGPLIGAAAFGTGGIRPGAALVNTARASLIDLDAVLSALESGHLAAYATDVFPTEPPAPHPLFAHDRVIVTPHLGGYTEESVDRAAQAAVDNLLRVLDAAR